MRFSAFPVSSHVLLTLLLSVLTSAKDSETSKPCFVKSPSTGSNFDLTPLTLHPPGEGKKGSKEDRAESWHARGYDYGANFTLNFCAPVIEQLEDVQGLDSAEDWRNVSAFYKKGDRTYSIGSVSTEPIFRGRKLVLNYTGGSPCPGVNGARGQTLLDARADHEAMAARELKDGDKDKDDKKKPSKEETDHIRRKVTVISFLCDRDPNAPKAAISFVGSVDECTYMFEARTPAACGGASTGGDVGSVGPAAVFGLIAVIAVAAYILGGVAYQRTVMHQRGWKQLPNYGTWAAIGNFVKDFFIVMFSSCSRLIPSRRGYNQLPTYSDRSRFSRNEDENRLIDQLDEDWDE